MNKSELVASIVESASLTKKDAKNASSGFLSVVEDTLSKGEKVQLAGFGTFGIRQGEAHERHSPRDPEGVIKTPANKTPIFHAGKALRRFVNE